VKILAVYGSKFGQAAAVLRRVSDVLAGQGHTVTFAKADALPTGLDIGSFGAVVVAASVIMGRHQTYVRRFVRENLEALQARPAAFISVNGAPPTPAAAWQAAAADYVDRFLEKTAWEPRWSATFAGALRYTRYSPVTRWVMRRISRRNGGPTDTSRDYEFTDWDAVDRFAEVIADGLDDEARGRRTTPWISAEHASVA
jgi:menaquinone-dependent protoporphyrinogen oxidase